MLSTNNFKYIICTLTMNFNYIIYSMVVCERNINFKEIFMIPMDADFSIIISNNSQ